MQYWVIVGNSGPSLLFWATWAIVGHKAITGPSRLFWATCDILGQRAIVVHWGHVRPSEPFWAIQNPLGNSGPTGPFITPMVIWTPWAILGHLSLFWPPRPFWIPSACSMWSQWTIWTQCTILGPQCNSSYFGQFWIILGLPTAQQFCNILNHSGPFRSPLGIWTLSAILDPLGHFGLSGLSWFPRDILGPPGPRSIPDPLNHSRLAGHFLPPEPFGPSGPLSYSSQIWALCFFFNPWAVMSPWNSLDWLSFILQ